MKKNNKYYVYDYNCIIFNRPSCANSIWMIILNIIAKIPKIKYIVRISLWLVENSPLFIDDVA